ncbi:transposase family protein [Streptomyces misionensis]|uniref:transposase family protein n=1 Tax=Streptomyces misionensis TaxID=67331 RepID=UPI0033C2F8B4
MARTAPGQACVQATEAGRGRGCEAPVGVRRPASGHARAPRHATTHDVLACWFGVDRSTITRAITEVRPLLAATPV